MAAPPPKITVYNENVVKTSPDIFTVNPTVPSAWRYFTGALGYWVPNALNRSARARAAIRALE